MTVFESKVSLNKAIPEVYTFLSDFNNHQRLMPPSISNWSSSRDEARFSIQNMAHLALKISNRIENAGIIIIPAADVPFNLEMRWILAELNNGTTEVILTLSAELNMMMKMMASGPLQKLVEHETSKLAEVF